MEAHVWTVNQHSAFACPVMEETSARQVQCRPFHKHMISPKEFSVIFYHLFFSCLSPADLDVCEPGWEKFQSFCYRHFAKRQSWEAAEQHCRMCGGHLLSVMTPEEQDYINGRFKWSGSKNHLISWVWCVFLESKKQIWRFFIDDHYIILKINLQI